MVDQPHRAAPSRGLARIVDVRDNAAAAQAAFDWVYDEWGWNGTGRDAAAAEFRDYALGAPRPAATFFAALDADGAPIGTAALVDDDGLDAPYDVASGATPWLAAVVTPPEHRGRGVATALVGAVVQLAVQEGWPRIWLHTATAASLYARLGFEEVSTVPSKELGRLSCVMRRELP